MVAAEAAGDRTTEAMKTITRWTDVPTETPIMAGSHLLDEANHSEIQAWRTEEVASVEASETASRREEAEVG